MSRPERPRRSNRDQKPTAHFVTGWASGGERRQPHNPTTPNPKNPTTKKREWIINSCLKDAAESQYIIVILSSNAICYKIKTSLGTSLSRSPGPKFTSQLEEESLGTPKPSVDPRVVQEVTKRDPSEGEPKEEEKDHRHAYRNYTAILQVDPELLL